MASNPEFVQYIADQLAPAGQVTYHKMFGDYGVYLDGKMFALVCDDQLYCIFAGHLPRTAHAKAQKEEGSDLTDAV